MLPVPWASFPSEDGPLLVKLLYLPAQNNLAIMATDLQHVYYESLNSRQTNRRFEDALLASKEAGETQSQSQTQTQDLMVGIGAEGEQLLHTLVEELVGSVTSGTARARITHAAFEVSSRSGTSEDWTLLRFRRAEYSPTHRTSSI